MDAFKGIFQDIGGLSGIGKGLNAATSLAGLISQYSLAGKEKAAMDRVNYYAKHPEAVSNLVSAAEKPLSTGLTKSVENVVNANLAEQGLGQAPGIQSQVLAQALAPYKQNEQQLALEQVMRTLGLPIEALAAIQSVKQPGGLNLANMLSQLKLPTSGSSGSGPGFQIPSLDPSGGDWGTSNPIGDAGGLTLPGFGGGTANG